MVVDMAAGRRTSPVAERRRKAMKKMDALRKKGVDIQPVAIEGRKIATSFRGEGWCEHLESFSDFENRLPRGRTYVRNGSVCHMAVAKGAIEAKVSGSELYDVKVSIKTLPGEKWTGIKGRCSGQIGSLLELLQGKLSEHVMGVVTDRKEGLFPLPGEMSFHCSCPDSASMCKHVAAVLYGVGARLDKKPELLFTLRGVDHEELIAADAEKAVAAATSGASPSGWPRTMAPSWASRSTRATRRLRQAARPQAMRKARPLRRKCEPRTKSKAGEEKVAKVNGKVKKGSAPGKSRSRWQIAKLRSSTHPQK